jgi:DNA-binding protein HU-beta
VNKAELIDALATRLGDKRTAGTALDAVLAEVQTAVAKGEKVSITGFGVFEKRTRAARMARNPRTGAAVRVKKTAVPAFRPGTNFKEMVASGRVPKTLKAAPAKKTTKATTARKTSAAKATRKTATKKAPAKRASTRRATKR